MEAELGKLSIRSDMTTCSEKGMSRKETCSTPVSENILSVEEYQRLREGTSHLSFETVIPMLDKFDNCVDSIIEYCKDKVDPDFMGKLSAQICEASCIDSKGFLSETQSSFLIEEESTTLKKFFKMNKSKLPPIDPWGYLKDCDPKDDEFFKLIYEEFSAKYPERVEKQEEIPAENIPHEEPQNIIDEEPQMFVDEEPQMPPNVELQTSIEKEEVPPPESARRPKRITIMTKAYSPEPEKKRTRESKNSSTEGLPARLPSDDIPSTSTGVRKWKMSRGIDPNHTETGLDVANGCLTRSPFNDIPSARSLIDMRRRGRVSNATGGYIGQSSFDIMSNNKDDIDTTVLEDMRHNVFKKQKHVEVVNVKVEHDLPEVSTEPIESAANDIPSTSNTAAELPREDVRRSTSVAFNSKPARNFDSTIIGGSETPSTVTPSPRNTDTPEG